MKPRKSLDKLIDTHIKKRGTKTIIRFWGLRIPDIQIK